MFFDNYNYETQKAYVEKRKQQTVFKPGKSYINFEFWQKVINHTEYCIKYGGSQNVSLIHSNDLSNSRIVFGKRTKRHGKNMEKPCNRKIGTFMPSSEV